MGIDLIGLLFAASTAVTASVAIVFVMSTAWAILGFLSLLLAAVTGLLILLLGAVVHAALVSDKQL